MSTGCNCDCGCSAEAFGVPENTANRPGLPALAYRIGTHAAFFEAMIARLSSQDFPALARLTTRDTADPSIALLDSWALIADVLTFYQERIANEGYLRTAIERRSVLELARLIGYKLRPGVAASVFLAYTLDPDRSKVPPVPSQTVIPAGSRCQSVPLGPPELPQSFETSADLDARSTWNILRPRQTQPHLFELKATADVETLSPGTIYFSGAVTTLKPGDPLLFVLGQDASNAQQTMRLVQSVVPQPAYNRTEVILQSAPIAAATANETALAIVSDAVKSYVADAAKLFPDSTLAAEAAEFLSSPPPSTTPGLLEAISALPEQKPSADAISAVERTMDQLTPLHDLAQKRNFTRLEPWLAETLGTLTQVIAQFQSIITEAAPAVAPGQPVIGSKGDRGPLGTLTNLLPDIIRPPSIQPLNSLRLNRSTAQAFAKASDMGPRLIGTFQPAAAPILYQSWANLETTSTTTEVGAIRVKAGLFPGAYPGVPTVTTTNGVGRTSFQSPPAMAVDWGNLVVSDQLEDLTVAAIALDVVNEKILPGSWVMIDRPNFGDATKSTVPPYNQAGGRTRTFHKVVRAIAASMRTSDGGFTSKVTQLVLDPPFLSDFIDKEDRNDFLNDSNTLGALQGTIVYAQTEMLPLAEEPLDVDLAGDTIELDKVYEGLESGRWIIVSGERTDIANVTGVNASEVVMILGVEQNIATPNTRPGPIHTILTLANKLAYTYDLGTVAIYGNVVKATHGETRNEVLGNGDGSQSFQQFKLKQKPVTFVAASNPEGTESTLAVYVNNVKWHEIDTLAALGPKDRNYITQTADDDTATVGFGNGKQGARLPTGAGNVMAIYRNGIGQPGNVKAGQINLLQTRPLNVSAVTNPLRASGGADRDSRDQARRNAPLAILALDRLVSVQDYADFARTFAGIGKASSMRVSDGQQDLVHLTIAGAGDIPIDVTSDLYGNLVLALQVNGDPYQPFQVALRGLRVLVISANLKILPDYLWEPVAAAVRTALLNAFSFDCRNLGQPVFQSEVISAMQAVEGVAYVDLDTFGSLGADFTSDDLGQLAAGKTLEDVVRAEFARPNPNPLNYPLDAFLPAEVACLRPDLPDTLILNEVQS